MTLSLLIFILLAVAFGMIFGANCALWCVTRDRSSLRWMLFGLAGAVANVIAALLYG